MIRTIRMGIGKVCGLDFGAISLMTKIPLISSSRLDNWIRSPFQAHSIVFSNSLDCAITWLAARRMRTVSGNLFELDDLSRESLGLAQVFTSRRASRIWTVVIAHAVKRPSNMSQLDRREARWGSWYSSIKRWLSL